MTRRDAPAARRNREPILVVLARWLEAPARVLELASGTGQHAVYFARRLPHLAWQPSDTDDLALASIAAWTQEEGASNVAAPIRLDVGDARWPEVLASAPNGAEASEGGFDAIFNANMIHIAPWNVAVGLFAGAGRVLDEHGLLFLYGPFRIGGAHTAPSNEAFDADLRRRDPEWGVRDLEAVENLAKRSHLHLVERNDLPANNQLVVFRKHAPSTAPA